MREIPYSAPLLVLRRAAPRANNGDLAELVVQGEAAGPLECAWWLGRARVRTAQLREQELCRPKLFEVFETLVALPDIVSPEARDRWLAEYRRDVRYGRPCRPVDCSTTPSAPPA